MSGGRRKSLEDVNPNERMKFHHRKRRFSSSDVDHRRYHDLLHNKPISPDTTPPTTEEEKKREENGVSLESQTEMKPASRKYRHEEHEYHEPTYEIHLYEHPPPPPLHHHHTNSQILPLEGSHKNPSQHLTHHHTNSQILPMEGSHKHPSQHLHHPHTNSQILPLEGSHKHELSQKDSSQLFHHHHEHPSTGESVKHPIHSIKVTPRLVSNVSEERILPAAQAAKIAKPGVLPADLKKGIPPKKLFLDIHAMSLITDHIVVGSLEDAYHLATLTEYGITHVLNLTSHGDNKFLDSFVYLQIPPKATKPIEENLEDYFPKSREFIDHVESLGGRVLVHCYNGMSRSPAVVLRYLIDRHELLLLPIFAHLMNSRPTADISEQFRLQLALFETQRLGRSSVQRNAGKEWDFYEWNRSA